MSDSAQSTITIHPANELSESLGDINKLIAQANETDLACYETMSPKDNNTASPSQSNNEDIPVEPVEPVIAVDPVIPVEPVTPVDPVIPVDTVTPVDPVIPVEPVILPEPVMVVEDAGGITWDGVPTNQNGEIIWTVEEEYAEMYSNHSFLVVKKKKIVKKKRILHYVPTTKAERRLKKEQAKRNKASSVIGEQI